MYVIAADISQHKSTYYILCDPCHLNSTKKFLLLLVFCLKQSLLNCSYRDCTTFALCICASEEMGPEKN